MADSTRAKYTFLPYVRQGLAAAVSAEAAAQAQPGGGRLSLPVLLRLSAQGGGEARPAEDIAVPLKLYGPGDIVGIDQREIVRVEPRNLTADFEPHYFPAVEFDRPDFPWMFSPTHPDAAGRLQPWLCLVVVRRGPGVSLSTAANRPLAVLECPRGELPDLADAWAWAHAQVARAALEGASSAEARGEIDRVLTEAPKQNVSRLLSPRRLDPNAAYLACLVPAYEAGRLAGLGEPVTEASLSDLQPAWAAPTEQNRRDAVTLPVYFHWEFSTGGGGDDFESLVRRLEVRGELPGVGKRQIDVSDPGWSMPRHPAQLPGGTLELEGALRAEQRPASQPGQPNFPPPPATPQQSAEADWPSHARQPFQARLREILNAPATKPSADPLVAPPIYGQWHAGRGIVPAPGEQPFWLQELNLDPRYRVAAGLGTLVVRYQQEELMAAAWEQVEEVERGNQRLRQAQLAREVGGNIHARLETLAPDLLLQVTEPAHAQVASARETADVSQSERSAAPSQFAHASASPAARRVPSEASLSAGEEVGGGAAVADEVVRSATPETAFSTAFRRLTRPRGPLARRLSTQALDAGGQATDGGSRAANGGARAAETSRRTSDASALAARPADENGHTLRAARRLIENPTAALPERDPSAGLLALDALAQPLRFAFPDVAEASARAADAPAPVEGVLLKATREATPPADFAFARADESQGATPAATRPQGATPEATRPAGATADTAAVFRAAAVAQQEHVLRATAGAAAATAQASFAPPLVVSDLAGQLLARLDPSVTVPAAVREDLRREAGVNAAEGKTARAGLAASRISTKSAANPAASLSAARGAESLSATDADGASESGGALEVSEGDPLEMVMAAPDFPRPMYEPLRDFHEMLLPGLENVPPNTLALLKTNPDFIEAYMVGLNHEMSRELLWREYPTDQRGTYFRQFWDARGGRRREKEITPIHRWRDDSHLGEHFLQPEGAQGAQREQLVLLIRGDILRRYPNAIIYAVKAAANRTFPESGTPELRYPLFRGVREPDITFIGFDLTEQQARGTTFQYDTEGGWFFVIQEQPTEPRFGLNPADAFGLKPEDLRHWRDVSWGHLAADRAAFERLTYARADRAPLAGKSIPAGAGVTWGANAGHMARIALQRAYRIAIHASAMLPPPANPF